MSVAVVEVECTRKEENGWLERKEGAEYVVETEKGVREGILILYNVTDSTRIEVSKRTV